VSPTPRKPRSKSEDEPETAADKTIDDAAEKPKRARRKPAAKKEPAAAAAEEKATKAPRRRRAVKADAPEATEPDAPEADAPEAVEEEAPKPKTTAKGKAKAEATKAPADAVADEKEADAAEAKPRRTRRTKATDPLPEAPEPAHTQKRAPRDPSSGPPMVRAHAKYVRTSARKARLVCDHIRGKSVEEARAILAHANRDVARDWMKLLESAVANAEHNHELVGDELRIHAVKADEGPTLKRFRPRAMGRATQIRKRTSHLTITLTPKDGEH
jgi:ribosomal protein L22